MKKFLVLVAAVCMAYTTAFAQTVKPFKEGDRAVFLGNSITDGGQKLPFIYLVVLHDPFPEYAYSHIQWRYRR